MPTHVILHANGMSWTTSVDGMRVHIGDTNATFDIAARPDGGMTITTDGRESSGTAVRDGRRVWVAIGAEIFTFDVDEGRESRRAQSHDPHALTPPMPATVLRVNVAAGATVANGDVLLVLEAMKMEIAIRAPHDGIVTAVHCQTGDLVQPGTVLVDFNNT